jgi:hypothetical protein
MKRNLFRAAVVFLAFSLGLLASTYQVGARSWVPAAQDKVKAILGIVPQFDAANFNGFSSQRYEFQTDWRFTRRGVYQLASMNEQVYAVDRNFGQLYKFSNAATPKPVSKTQIFKKLNIEKTNKANQ